MNTSISRTNEPLTLEEQAEQVTMAAVTAAINCGFDPAGTRNLTVKQVVDACAIIVTFLQEAERGPPRTVSEWRVAVENLTVSLGVGRPTPTGPHAERG